MTTSGREIPGAAQSLSASVIAEVWPAADSIVLAAPSTAETNVLVDAAALRAMKKDAWLVNIARGTLIDTAALVDALTAGQIGGAALDVTDPEPLPADHPLWRLPNVLITPHMANPLASRLPRLAAHVEATVARFIAGTELKSPVDLGAGY